MSTTNVAVHMVQRKYVKVEILDGHPGFVPPRVHPTNYHDVCSYYDSSL